MEPALSNIGDGGLRNARVRGYEGDWLVHNANVEPYSSGTWIQTALVLQLLHRNCTATPAFSLYAVILTLAALLPCSLAIHLILGWPTDPRSPRLSSKAQIFGGNHHLQLSCHCFTLLKERNLAGGLPFGSQKSVRAHVVGYLF